MLMLLSTMDMSQGAFFLAAGLVPQHSLVARSGSCLALAMYGIFVGCASFLWTAALAYFLYVLVVCQRHAGSFRALAGWRPQWRRDVACACAVTVYEILRQWEVPE